MSRRWPRRLGVAAAVVSGGGVLAGVAGLGAARRLMRRELAGPDPAADDDFSCLDELIHHSVASHDGGSLHVVERGDPHAQPLLFVHGVTLVAEIWRYQLRDLADQFRVLAIDQRGHGKSEVGRDGWGVDRLGQDLATVIRELDLRNVIVIGHSMGGFATQKLCIDHPALVSDRVAGVVLINTSSGNLLGRGFPGLGVERMLPLARRAVQAAGRPRARTSAGAAYLGARWTLGRGASPTHVRLTSDLAQGTRPEVMIGSTLAFLDMDLRVGLRDLRVPALVVAGTHDRLTPPRHARQIVAHLPGSRLEVLEGAGHMIMLERHRELDRLIRDFALSLAAGAGPAPSNAGLVAGTAGVG